MEILGKRELITTTTRRHDGEIGNDEIRVTNDESNLND